MLDNKVLVLRSTPLKLTLFQSQGEHGERGDIGINGPKVNKREEISIVQLAIANLNYRENYFCLRGYAPLSVPFIGKKEVGRRGLNF